MAFGLWPALPLTGYWLFSRYCHTSGVRLFPRVTAFALMTVGGIALWSIPLLVAAVMGVYHAEYIGLLGWMVTLRGVMQLVKLPKASLLPFQFGSFWDWVLVCGLVGAGWLYLGFPNENIFGENDSGVYANHAVYIAHHGRLDIPYPDLPVFRSSFRPITPRHPIFDRDSYLPGILVTPPTMTVYFGHLFPVWLAQAFATFGPHGLFRLNALLAGLSVAVFYGMCRSAVPKACAVVGTLFLALNPSEIWLARVTLAEMFTQLLVWSGLLLLARSVQRTSLTLARGAGVCLGLSALVRIDSLLLAPLLLLVPLMLKIIEDWPARRLLPVWAAFYQIVFPLLVLAVGYYAFWSTPYFYSLSAQLRKIGVASAAALVLLLATSSRTGDRLRPWLTGKTALLLICAGVWALAAYAYGIRPHIGHYTVIDRPGHPLDGLRDYREDSLVNLAVYLSLPVLWTALLGWCVTLYTVARKKGDVSLTTGLVVVAGFSAVYLWAPMVAPQHFWAIRRFVPVVIPGFIFFATCGAWSIISMIPRRWSVAVCALVLAFLAMFTVRATTPILTVTENSDSFSQIEHLANRLPHDALILAHGSTAWMVPLFLVFDRKIIPIDLNTRDSAATVRRWLASQPTDQTHQMHLYLLSEENIRMVGTQGQKLGELVLARSNIESTVKPLPQKIVSQQTTINIYRITAVSEHVDYRTIALGAEKVWGVQDTGFYETERLGDSPVRWTKGRAKLIVPLDGQQPTALQVELHAAGPHGTILQVYVNGDQLFSGHIPEDGWLHTFHFADCSLGDQAVIELVSDTFVPKDTIPGSEDQRSLGVMVHAIRLLAGDQQSSSDGIKESGK